MNVRAKEIAKAVGVSTPVVSKVLYGGSSNVRVGKETRAKVIEAAQRLGYRPNLAAQATRSGKFHAIGHVVVGEEEGYPMAGSSVVTASVIERLGHHGYRMVSSYIRLQEINQGTLPDVMRFSMAEGLLLDRSGRVAEKLFEAAERYKMPFISINHRTPLNAVHPDDQGAARQATQHLLDAGHRRIAYHSYEPDESRFIHYSMLDRQAGYEQAMQDAGFGPRLLSAPSPVDPNTQPRGVGRLQELITLMKQPDAPTAYVTYGQTEAEDLLQAAFLLGRSVPEDIALVCVSRAGSPPCCGGLHLACMHISDYQLGRLSADRIVHRLEQGGKDLDTQLVHGEWRPADTFGPPRRP